MKDSHSFAEMALFFCAFFLPGYAAQALGAPTGPATDALMIQSIIAGLPQFLLMAYVVIVSGRTPASRWGLGRVEPRDGVRAALLTLGCFLVVTPFVALVLALPPEVMRRFSQGYRWGLSNAAQLPVALLFGLTAGYREEFFFRAYLLGRMDELGVPAPAAVAMSTALFCIGHFYEGLLAVAVTAALGLLLAAAWRRWGSLHVVAVAHGMYNVLVLCLGLVLPRTLPDPAVMRMIYP